jgi:GDP-L-fucose synthase
MDNNSAIYIAGHNGLVGSAITSALQDMGYNNLILRSSSQLDLRNQAAVRDFFAAQKPEYIFLAAAHVGGIMANATYPAEFIYDNLMIAANVMESAREFGVKKLLNLGSSCIYPKMAEQPISEESLLTGPLEPTNEPYAIAKIAAIKLCTSYHTQYGCDYISLMPTNLYGERDNFNLFTSHVLPALIRKFILALLLEKQDFTAIAKDLCRDMAPAAASREQLMEILASFGIQNGSVTLWGSGKVYREFLHAADCAAAAIYFMKNISADQADTCVNIGTGTDITIHQLATLIAGLLQYKGQIIFDISKPDGTPRKLLNTQKATALGWQASIPLNEGIQRVIRHYYATFLS